MRKFLKWVGIVLLAFVAIALVVNAWFVSTTGARLERQLAAIREAGDPLSLADLARPPIPSEKNAATYLQRASADVQALMAKAYEAPGFRDYGSSMKDPMSAEIKKTLEAVFLAYPKVIPLLQQAAECSDYDAQLDYTRLPWDLLSDALSAQNILRGDMRVLTLRVRLLVAERNYEEALQTVLVMFRLAHHSEHFPGVNGLYLVTTFRRMAIQQANDVLQTGTVSKKVRDALDAELALSERIDDYVWTIKSERADDLSWFRSCPLRNFWLFYRGRFDQWESQYLDEMQAFEALARDPRPYRETTQIIDNIQAKVPPAKGDNSLGQYSLEQWRRPLFPAVGSAHELFTRTRATIRCLRVLNALQTHVPAGSDGVPKLAELGLPAETTTDPFTGEPLHIKTAPRGWLVYSVGENLQDDGGKIDDYRTDVGVGPPPLAAKPNEPASK
jgi:hypothetical protein